MRRLTFLPQAAKRIESLLHLQNPTGDDRGRVLLHLATLYKRDQQDKMLSVTLDRLAQVPIEDPKLLKERLLFQARFQEGVGQPEKALALLQAEESHEGLRLKARLAWKISDWPLVSKNLNQLLVHPQTTPGEREEFLISLAVSLYKQGDTASLPKLRQSFLSSFQTPQKKETFLLLTSQKPEISQNPTYKELLAQIAAIEGFEKSLHLQKEPQK